ncbi:hypothetical protein J3R03_009828 [Actinoplanes couchii]|uniref:hypothetical protein n=1 Tax=Actinoplanes couchii TaxID=403638 RepID=UPI0027DD8141|nr:hypothetical protein [Actinoplanes couchii]MDR6325632.1 hypothetical protein [Actinoplanes couchii]
MQIHSRRVFLGVVAAGSTALAGCGLFDDGPEPDPQPDPLQPLLDEALALAGAYDRVIVATPNLAARLTPLAEDHRAHATELTKLIGAAVASIAPSASAPAGPTDTTATLRKAEQAAQKTAVAACRAAPRERAALVGSIAACRATHAEALR